MSHTTHRCLADQNHYRTNGTGDPLGYPDLNQGPLPDTLILSQNEVVKQWAPHAWPSNRAGRTVPATVPIGDKSNDRIGDRPDNKPAESNPDVPQQVDSSAGDDIDEAGNESTKQANEATQYLQLLLEEGPTDGELLSNLKEALGSYIRRAEPEIILNGSSSMSDQVLIILNGMVTVQAESGTIVTQLGPGEPIGALELWTGCQWPLLIKTQTECEYIVFPIDDFRSMLRQCEALRRVTGTSVTIMMRHIRLFDVLKAILGQVPDDLLALMQRKAQWHHLNSGEILFAQDDYVESLFLVISGRLHQTYIGVDGNQLEVGHIESGEVIGTFFEPIQAPIKSMAVRETTMLEFPAELRQELWEKFPLLVMPFLQSIISRERNILNALDKRTEPPATLAIIPATGDTDLLGFVYDLSLAMARFGSVRPLTREDVDANYGQKRVADIPRHHPMHPLLIDWLQQLESAHDWLLYVGDATWSEWTQRCLHQADRVLIVANASNPPEPSMTEQAIYESVQHAQVDLVLLHEKQTTYPTGTAKWLELRPIHTHYHVRQHSAGQYTRLARRITGNAIGVVLAGGGARGFAHIGLLQAMEKYGIPYDYVGGTSMGALIGGAFAMGWNSTYVLEQAAQFGNRKALFDYTLPLVSLFESDKITEVMQKQFGNHCIEDLWYPYFAVSTDLTAGSMMLHDRGPLWLAVRASLSIPAVFTPVVNEDGHLLVDGGVMNNFPVDIMRQRVEGGRIIGVNLHSHEEEEEDYRTDLSISGWKLLRSHLNPVQNPPKVPNMGQVLVRSMMVNNQQAMKRAEHMCDLLLNPDVNSFGLLQFDRYAEIVDVGYEAAVRSDLSSIYR
ncbi:MAG: patatin-like phospholipase family protein [Chloroflexota bacterium]